MEWIHGETEFESRGGDVESHMRLSVGEGGAEEQRKRGARHGSRTMADSLRDTTRAGFDRARGLTRANDVIDVVKRYPLVSIGAAFVTGFAVGFATDAPERHWAVERTRRRIRAALLSGMTAVAARELRSFVGNDHELAGLFDSLLGPTDDASEVEEYDY